LFVTPSPNVPHQIIAGAIYAELRAYLRGSQVGHAMISPSGVWRGERKKNRVQPDVFVVRFAEGRKSVPFPFHMETLLLAIEVVSPGNPRLDYHTKRDLFMREGLPDYWVVDPEARNVSRWRGCDDPGEVLSNRVEWHPVGMSAPFVLELEEVWKEAFFE
jgi:Uma2 family endonuclease